MSDPLATAQAAVDAARTGDLARLHTLVDWPLTGAGPMSRALHDVLEHDRSGILASGLAELDAAATEPAATGAFLGDLAERLAGTRQVRPATDDEADRVREFLTVAPAPAGVTDEQRSRLDTLRRQVSSLGPVVVAEADPPLPCAVAPDTGRLVPVLD